MVVTKKGTRNRNKVEWSERVVAVQRVTKVVKGGKKLSFRAVIVVGNQTGQVGVGVGKASDVSTAVRKAVTDGKKKYYYSSIDKLQFYPT
jgi:small subunit ribosomal protein S5